MLGSHLTHWVEGEQVLREVFSSSDGRILGTEVIYRQREAVWDPYAGEIVTAVDARSADSREFRSLRDAGDWIEELRARENIVRCQLSGGTILALSA